MIFPDDPTTNDASLNTLGEEQAAAWVREERAAAWARFYAIEVDSRPGELEYDRALATAKRLDAAVAEIVAAAGGRPKSDWPFEPSRTPAATLLDVSPAPLTLARPAQRAEPIRHRVLKPDQALATLVGLGLDGQDPSGSMAQIAV